jgi:hypothetical protein
MKSNKIFLFLKWNPLSLIIMNNHINEFLRILRDNNYEQKYYSSIDEIKILPFTNEDIPKDISEDEVEASESLAYYELNGYSDFNDLEDYLNENLYDFKIAYIADGCGKDKSLKHEIIQQITIIKSELGELKETVKFLKDFALIALIRTKTNFCDEVISFITNQEIRIKPRRQKDSDNPNRLKQKEAVILFYYLRDLGLISKGMQNNEYAQYISDLTGYEAEKIRQDLSNINKKSSSTDKTRIQDSDYDGIKRALEKKLIIAISADKKEKFPSSK